MSWPMNHTEREATTALLLQRQRIDMSLAKIWEEAAQRLGLDSKKTEVTISDGTWVEVKKPE